MLGIGKYQIAEDLSLIKDSLEDSNIDVRMEAIKVLGRYERSEELQWLFQVANDFHKHKAERVVAIEAIATTGKAHRERAWALVSEFIRDRTSDVQRSAMKALLEINRAEAVMAIREIFRNRERDAKQAAKKISPEYPELRQTEYYLASTVGHIAGGFLLEYCSPAELEEWLNEDKTSLNFSLVAELDYKIYCPAWWKADETEWTTGPEYRSTGF